MPGPVRAAARSLDDAQDRDTVLSDYVQQVGSSTVQRATARPETAEES
jgi:hypothetical protein